MLANKPEAAADGSEAAEEAAAGAGEELDSGI